ncbi:hypothetical protein BV25DRAFT_262370 [Artomyces pyxidatus]|uniref:Uncharacterized protein n=1 Tax=Artomyces pyxidatus TaxID=48021 RepID=A0ACB8T816_9AGAM|nr:hypothetical protein BV25DRAFT_262370 [Artomyces pyxidatus]
MATPVQSFLGGVGLALSVQTLLAINGNVFGISGFLHRSMRGSQEGAAAVAGLALGGVLVGFIEGTGPHVVSTAWSSLIASGALVGFGTKLSNGCTSGHMICGMSRLSTRSIAATVTFVTAAAATARFLHPSLPPIARTDLSLGAHGAAFLAGSALALLTTLAIAPSSPVRADAAPAPTPARMAVAFFTALSFALSLRLSNLVDPLRVLGFLLLPTHPAFDPSLGFLALGALPLAMLLYRTGRTKVDAQGAVDARLLVGAALFGVGWGVEGICPGPGLVNFGQALAAGSGTTVPLAAWVAAVVVGGALVPS